MARKLPGNVRCSVFYCSIRSCLWALYIWVIFIEIQHTTLQARKSAKDFIFKMQQLHDPFLPSTTSNFSLKRKRRHKTQCRFEYLCFAFSLATEMMWKSSKDWQWIATEICLFFFLILFLISSCPEENVKDYVPVICRGPKKNRALVWEHQGNKGICHPLQNSRVLRHPHTQPSSCFGCVSVSWSSHCRDGRGLRSPVFM